MTLCILVQADATVIEGRVEEREPIVLGGTKGRWARCIDEDFWRYLIAIGAAQSLPIPPPDYIAEVLADKDAARTALQDLGG